MKKPFDAAAARRDAANHEREARERRASEKLQRMLSLPPIDSNRRYTLDAVNCYLGQSRAKTFRDIKAGKIRTQRDGRRVFVHGEDLIAASRPAA